MNTDDDPGAVVRRLLECFNDRRFDDVDELYAPDFHTHPFGTGAEAGRAAWRRLVDRYPTMRLVADDVLVVGDKVTVRSSVQDTGTLAFGATPILIEVFRVENGRLAEWWGSTWLPDLA